MTDSICDPAKPGLSRLEVDDDSRLRHVEPLLFFCGFKQQEMLQKKKQSEICTVVAPLLSALSVFVLATQLLESASVCRWLMVANGGGAPQGGVSVSLGFFNV